MKRIKIFDNIYDIIFEAKENSYNIGTTTKQIVTIIQNNYRRRKYKQKFYTCSKCGQLLKPNVLCECRKD